MKSRSCGVFHVVSCRVYVCDAGGIEIHSLESGRTPLVLLHSRPLRKHLAIPLANGDAQTWCTQISEGEKPPKIRKKSSQEQSSWELFSSPTEKTEKIGKIKGTLVQKVPGNLRSQEFVFFLVRFFCPLRSTLLTVGDRMITCRFLFGEFLLAIITGQYNPWGSNECNRQIGAALPLEATSNSVTVTAFLPAQSREKYVYEFSCLFF